MTAYTVAQGRSIALPVEWLQYPGGPASPVTAVTLEISPSAGGTAVVGPTGSGVTNPATGVNVYTWQVPAAQAAGDYLVIWRGTDGDGDQVQATDILTVIEQPAASALYATLPQLKAARRITAADDDAALTRALAAACRMIDRRCGRTFTLAAAPAPRVFGVAGRVTPAGVLLVDDIASTTGLLVETGSGETWTSTTAWEPSPFNSIEIGWPITELASPLGYWSSRSVRVTARWGWPTVPDEISMAAVLLANRLYMRKDSPEGVAGSSEWGAVRLSRWDPDAEALIAPYVLPGIA
ncbi:hypothetical protein O7622_01220 [Micromonospora sp. WMMD1076]|uniref:hypothetical protein n=1 Tax=Micromonospora sp. WMMD1076 TaxID=3016103 RepID=UPI002499CAEC|nr:hypothetical protein [Micromonospora sp. WMMD1076]WFF07251.1 hypothetical protein O7622_01220 [Micromonospora sp. WMMD1076]